VSIFFAFQKCRGRLSEQDVVLVNHILTARGLFSIPYVELTLIKDGKKQTRTFSTMTDDLPALSDRLTAAGCIHVSVESTGVYWKLVFSLLEGAGVPRPFRR
jgi:hypothetical protein